MQSSAYKMVFINLLKFPKLNPRTSGSCLVFSPIFSNPIAIVNIKADTRHPSQTPFEMAPADLNYHAQNHEH